MGTPLFSSTLTAFFATVLPFVSSPGDPKIIYDAIEDRFVVVALQFPGGMPRSSILLAVSKTGTPASATTSDWNFGFINSFVNGNWADYPGFAVDEEAIYITNNMFRLGGGFMESRLWIVAKIQFYDNGSVESPQGSPFALTQGGNLFTYQPAVVSVQLGPEMASAPTWFHSATYPLLSLEMRHFLSTASSILSVRRHFHSNS